MERLGALTAATTLLLLLALAIPAGDAAAQNTGKGVGSLMNEKTPDPFSILSRDSRKRSFALVTR